MDLSSGERNGVSLYVLCCSVNGSVFLCVACLFGDCLVKQIAILCLGVVVILLLNVMELFSGGALLDIPSMVFQRVCVRCAVAD